MVSEEQKGRRAEGRRRKAEGGEANGRRLVSALQWQMKNGK
jgi:hypothetical protein